MFKEGLLFVLITWIVFFRIEWLDLGYVSFTLVLSCWCSMPSEQRNQERQKMKTSQTEALIHVPQSCSQRAYICQKVELWEKR